jgi:RNA recognition motif-containing protein
MSFTVFLGNLPVWVTADDIKSWLAADNLVADAVKVIRNPETQESKGFAFIEAPNQDEMNSIIRRFDRAPLEDRLLRANPAQPPKGKGQVVAKPTPAGDRTRRPPSASGAPNTAARDNRDNRDRRTANRRSGPASGNSVFAEELAKVL